MACLTVNQAPVNVNIECEKCNKDITIDYMKFIKVYGGPCDWINKKVKCPHCGHENEIESWDIE